MKWYTWFIALLIVANVIALVIYVGSQPPPTTRIIVCTDYQPEYIQPGLPQKVGVWCFEARDL